jgi:hypothetical protein
VTLLTSPWLASLHSSTWIGVATHVVASSLIIVAAIVLEPIIKSSAAQLSAPGLQGKLFGTLATITGVGEALGSMLMTRLLASKHHQVDWLGPSISVVAPLACVSAIGALLAVVLWFSADHVPALSPTALVVPRRFDSKTV